MNKLGSIFSSLSAAFLVLPEFCALGKSATFWILAAALICISVSTRLILVPGPKILADVSVANGGVADAGFFFFQIAYTFGCGVGVLVGPPAVAHLGFRASTLVIACLCLTGPVLLRDVVGVDPDDGKRVVNRQRACTV